MSDSKAEIDSVLKLRCGDLVEVKGKQEILATLDERGELDGLVFMPEMMQFCGRRLRVERTAHKTCDTITGEQVGLRLDNCVHLKGARCDGSEHGGCQAECLFFWKEAWLKPIERKRPSLVWRLVASQSESSAQGNPAEPRCTEETVARGVVSGEDSATEQPIYRCQVTELLAATKRLPWWEPTQYARDWLSGNVSLAVLLRSAFFRMFYRVVIFGKGYRLKVKLYNGLAKLLGETPYPYTRGRLSGKTPSRRLDLQPGELVKVKPHAEILQTLNGRHNRGLGFAPEMVRYCGGTFRVRSRVSKIIDEPTGKMMHFGNECIILEDVICRSECSNKRLFCPRSIYSYWREIWLERVVEDQDARTDALDSGNQATGDASTATS